MSLTYATASSLNHKIDRLSSLVSYQAPNVTRPGKSLIIGSSVTSASAPGGHLGENALSFVGDSNSYISINNTAADWNATAVNATDGGANGKLWFKDQGQLTIECFLYLNSTGGGSIGLLEYGSGGCALGYGGSGFWYFAHSQQTYGMTWTPASPPTTGVWYHLAWCRYWNGSYQTYTFYLDGVSQGVAYDNFPFAGSTPFNGLTTPAIGNGNGGGGFYLNGYMQEFRISNINRYPSNFTPTTVPFTNDSNTLLLLHGTSPIQDDNS